MDYSLCVEQVRSLIPTAGCIHWESGHALGALDAGITTCLVGHIFRDRLNIPSSDQALQDSECARSLHMGFPWGVIGTTDTQLVRTGC